jgi:hypothetical protein
MPYKPTGNGFFVLTYGDETDPVWEKIRDAEPNFVITPNA